MVINYFMKFLEMIEASWKECIFNHIRRKSTHMPYVNYTYTFNMEMLANVLHFLIKIGRSTMMKPRQHVTFLSLLAFCWKQICQSNIATNNLGMWNLKQNNFDQKMKYILKVTLECNWLETNTAWSNESYLKKMMHQKINFCTATNFAQKMTYTLKKKSLNKTISAW